MSIVEAGKSFSIATNGLLDEPDFIVGRFSKNGRDSLITTVTRVEVLRYFCSEFSARDPSIPIFLKIYLR